MSLHAGCDLEFEFHHGNLRPLSAQIKFSHVREQGAELGLLHSYLGVQELRPSAAATPSGLTAQSQHGFLWSQ